MVALKEAPLKTKEKSRSPVALGRRKEFNIQIHQLIDAVVLVLSLWLAYLLRYELAELFKSISPLESALCLGFSVGYSFRAASARIAGIL